jgi:hypothetical protein
MNIYFSLLKVSPDGSGVYAVTPTAVPNIGKNKQQPGDGRGVPDKVF